MDLYEKIRQDSKVKYGTEVSNYIQLIIQQYSDRTHFIYELLQNAEDAGATYIKFHLFQSNLTLYHNGRPFNEADINGVCGIARGTKGDGTRIGHFGIGFKAVYGYTMNPEIYSDKYCFKIDSFVNPYEIKGKPGLAVKETCMILPFNNETVSEQIAFKEIKDALLHKISAESILILDSIKDIEIKIEGMPETIRINKEKRAIDGDNVFELNLLSLHGDREREQNYLFFTDAEKEACSLIFRVENKEIQAVKNSKIYAFFPTAKEAHQNFYIHAPFDTTPARDNFKEGEDFGKHNIKLVNNICRLIQFTFIWLRDHGYLTFEAMNKVYPIYEYEENDLLYAIYENSIDFIKSGEPLLPTNTSGIFKSINDICVPENMGIVNVFNDEDLQRIIGNHKIYWLSKEISTREYVDFKKFLDRNFEFKTYEWRHLVLKLTANFLEEKSIEWLDRLLGNIEGFCVKRIDNQSHFINVSSIPFVRLANGRHICAKEDGKSLVYINNPTSATYQIDKACLENDSIRSFYERALNIFAYNIEQDTIDKILPKYDSPDVIFKTDNHIRENIQDLKQIKEALQTSPYIIDQVTNRYIVTDGKEWYRPSDLYIRSNDVRSGYDLVRGIIDIKFLANSYFDDTVLNITLDEDFFKSIGCHKGLKELKVSKEEYLSKVKKYCGKDVAAELKTRVVDKTYISEKWGWSFSYEGFPQLFIDISPEKSNNIARFLNANEPYFTIKGNLVGSDSKSFSGNSVDGMDAYSMLGLYLCFEKWVYVKSDDEAHRPIDVDRDDLLDFYKASKRIIDALPFKETSSELEELLIEKMGADNAEVAKFIQALINNPEEALNYKRAKEKSEAKIAAQEEKKRSLKERLESSDRTQKEYANNREFESNPISEKALEKRSKKLEEELVASLDNHVSVTRGVHFTRRDCNPEERTFLKEEYEGYCQMCQKKIIKYDGSCYFEAINVIKQSTIYDELANSFGLGWNSMSLCPNCAAEYNYCSKKISTIYEQVMSTEIEPGSEEFIEIEVEIPEGKQRTIKYSPRHFLALKKAFEVLAKE